MGSNTAIYLLKCHTKYIVLFDPNKHMCIPHSSKYMVYQQTFERNDLSQRPHEHCTDSLSMLEYEVLRVEVFHGSILHQGRPCKSSHQTPATTDRILRYYLCQLDLFSRPKLTTKNSHKTRENFNFEIAI